MRNTNTKYIILLFIVSVFFVGGLVNLFMLRFETGDIYPQYSSLRSDPLGTRAFYESLELCLQGSLQRNYLPYRHIPITAETTFLYLGASISGAAEFLKPEIGAVDRILASGGRVVIAFRPIRTTSGSESVKRSERKTVKTKGGENKARRNAFSDHWGVDIAYEKNTSHTLKAVPGHGYIGGGMPSALSWHSTLYFKDFDTTWRVIYTRNRHPVIIEKKVVSGTLVLSADSYLFSNEALQKERYPKLLLWVVGPHSHVVFDEYHFGVRKHIGVADLARKYRLHWLGTGILLLAVLFIWKNASSFIPPMKRPENETVIQVTGAKDHTEGLISLLRRNIKTKDILSVCVSEFKKTYIHETKTSLTFQEKMSRIDAILLSEKSKAGKEINQVKTYRTICQILSKRKKL